MDCGVNLLMHVSATCDADKLREIIALGPNLDQRDRIGRTALHFACRAGKIDTFNVLVENESIELDAATNAGVTPLMMAVESG